MKRLSVVSLVLALLFLLFVASAAAKPRLNWGSELNAAQCNPGAGNMVLNIVFQVTNDADSGFGGYWGIDSYMKHIQVWEQSDGTFCVQAKYNGSFVTVAGNSPGNTGTVSAGVTGTMEGGYTAVISNATFNPGTKRTKGNIGAKDYGCVITNGSTLQNGQDTCNPYDWFTDYFTDGDFNYSGPFQWGWIYDAGNNGTWVNASSGSSGDITGQ